MALPRIEASGNLTADPDLKFTSSGVALVSFTVACNDRRQNPHTQEWEDGDTTFLRVTVWRKLAENVASSFRKGDPVRVTGKLKQRDYETKEGEKRTSYEVDGDSAGHDLSRGTSSFQRASAGGAAPGGGYAPSPAAPPRQYGETAGGGYAAPGGGYGAQPAGYGAPQGQPDWTQPSPAAAQPAQYAQPVQPAQYAQPAQPQPTGAGAVAWNTQPGAAPAAPAAAPPLGGFGSGFDDEQPF